MTRSKTSKAWMREHVNDPYVKRAQAEGARSRAVYKLQQIDERDRLLKPGMTVVDLGAAPGGWSQLLARRVTPGGRVIAVDLIEMPPLPCVVFIQGDFGSVATLDLLEHVLGNRPVDLVLSDMSPHISGIASVDQARAGTLAELALDFVLKHLKPQGNFLVKSFQGEAFEAFIKTLRRHFTQVVTRKPQASRSRSSEVYLLGKGYRRGRSVI